MHLRLLQESCSWSAQCRLTKSVCCSSLLFSSIFCVTRTASSFLCSTLLNIPRSLPRGPRPPPPAQQLQPCSSCYSNKVSPRPVPALSRRGTGPHNPRTQVPSPPHPPAPSLLPPGHPTDPDPHPAGQRARRGARGGIERRRDRTYDRHTGQADAAQRTDQRLHTEHKPPHTPR